MHVITTAVFTFYSAKGANQLLRDYVASKPFLLLLMVILAISSWINFGVIVISWSSIQGMASLALYTQNKNK